MDLSEREWFQRISRWILYLAASLCGLLLLGNLFWSLQVFPPLFSAWRDDIFPDLRLYHLIFGILCEMVYVLVLAKGLICFPRAAAPVWVAKAVVIADGCDALVWLAMMDVFIIGEGTGMAVTLALASKYLTIPFFVLAAIVDHKMRRWRQQDDESAALGRAQ